MAVADVPGARLDRAGDVGSVGDCLADLLATLLLSDHLGGVVCHHHGEQFFVGHLGFVHAVILQGQDRGLGSDGDSSPTVTALPSLRSSRLHQWRRYPMPHRHESAQASVRSVPASCSARTYPMGSHCRHNTLHMLWRCCTETHHCRSTGQHSRFRRLPNRCMWGGCWSCVVCVDVISLQGQAATSDPWWTV